MCSQKRDTYAGILGHQAVLRYMAVAEGVPIQRLRAHILEQMVDPVGPPPATKPGEALDAQIAALREASKNAVV